jgi:hypothetical protein
LNDYELLDLPPLTLHGGSLSFFDLVMKLELLLCLLALPEPVIGNGQSIVSLA